MLLADVGSTAYNIVLVLHLIAVVIGFGGVALNGVYGRTALEHKGPAGGLVAGTNTKASKIAEIAIFTVPVWGIFLVILSDDTFTFGQPWVSASFTLYIVAMALALGVIRPAAKKFDAAVADPERGGEAEKLGTLLAVVGGIANLAWVVIIFLMVFKPGL